MAGGTLGPEWAIVATSFALGAAFTVFAAYRLAGSLAIAILVTAFEILIYPRTYSYPKVLAYAAGAWVMIALAAKPSLRRVVLMASVIAVAFLLRHDHGMYIGIASAACIALASRSEGWRVAIRRVAMLTGATAALLLPWILFIALNGGLVAYFGRAAEYARSETSETKLTSWPWDSCPREPQSGQDRSGNGLALLPVATDFPGEARSAAGPLSRAAGVVPWRGGRQAAWLRSCSTGRQCPFRQCQRPCRGPRRCG